jgi:hypothetical protein
VSEYSGIGQPPQGDPPKARKRKRFEQKRKGQRSQIGGDRRSKQARANSRAFEDQVFDLKAHGFKMTQIAERTHKNEDSCWRAFRRGRARINLGLIEEARLQAQFVIDEEIAFSTIRIRQLRAHLESPDTMHLFDPTEYDRHAMRVLRYMERKAKMMGLDAPNRTEWVAERSDDDRLTDAQLDNLTADELRELFRLMDIACNGRPPAE